MAGLTVARHIIIHSVETRTNTKWPVIWWFTRQWVEHYSRDPQFLGHSIVSQHFMEPEGFNTEFTRVLHLSLSWARPIQSTSPHHTSTRSILILSLHYPIFIFMDVVMWEHCTLDCEILYVAKFTNVTPLSLLIWRKRSFPLYKLLTFQLPIHIPTFRLFIQRICPSLKLICMFHNRLIFYRGVVGPMLNPQTWAPRLFAAAYSKYFQLPSIAAIWGGQRPT
jgi:hypothetical protein